MKANLAISHFSRKRKLSNNLQSTFTDSNLESVDYVRYREKLGKGIIKRVDPKWLL